MAKFVFEFVRFIPPGKVATYKQVSQALGIKNPRRVGQILHQNINPKKYPCHRVIKADGTIASGYAFGGKHAQFNNLKNEGVVFKDNVVDLVKSQWKSNKTIDLYFQLLKKYGFPGRWPWFRPVGERYTTPDEIIIGAILTQNTNWFNVQKAINNLKKEHLCTLNDVCQVGESDLEKLKKLILPAGFCNQKAVYLHNISRVIVQKFKNLENLKKIPIFNLRPFLLEQKGIGEETADTILLYALDLPTFIIDTYTKRFVQKFNLSNHLKYPLLKKFFENKLPKDLLLYQNYHALIVRWGKDRNGARSGS